MNRLRIDPQLWSEIEAIAQVELRSVNGQIEFMLREALQRRRHRRAPVDRPRSREGNDADSR